LYPKYTAEEMKKFFEEEEKYKQYLQLKESTQSLRASS
jgi:adenylosuccinate lyase